MQCAQTGLIVNHSQIDLLRQCSDVRAHGNRHCLTKAAFRRIWNVTSLIASVTLFIAVHLDASRVAVLRLEEAVSLVLLSKSEKQPEKHLVFRCHFRSNLLL